MIRRRSLALLAVLVIPSVASAQWSGFVDRSTELTTSRFPFTGTAPEAGTGNENYYDGDLGDFDGDGLPDRLLGSRFGLLFNTGDGLMVPARRRVGLLLRGDPGASGWGEDAMQWADIDGDGDLEALAGGNGEPLTAQWNAGGRFSVAFVQSGARASALNIVSTDLERDGDGDIVVAHAFCSGSACGGPVNFAIYVNDGAGTFTEETAARGITFGTGTFIVGVVSGDVDGDGDFDLLIQRGSATDAMRRTVLARNDGTGSFTVTATPIGTGGSGFGQGMNLGDIDDDGDLDLVITRGDAPSPGGHPVISALIGINDGTGTFTEESATRLDDAGRGGVMTGENGKLFDVDYDGDLDILMFDKDNASAMTHLWVLLNDGAGSFRLDLPHSFPDVPGPSSGLGSDVDIADLDGDGTYDVWVGLSGGNVRELMNRYVAAGGVHADTPRNLRASSAGARVTLTFEAPPFAANARQYVVYRSLAGLLGDRDRVELHRIGLSRFQDEGFVAPITRHTTTAYLGDPAVTLNGAANEITFEDTTALPGVTYHYSVSHVGAEHQESEQTATVTARLPPAAGADTTPPSLEIVSPDAEQWGRFPRVVVTYADGGSGIDPSTLSVSFDRALGGTGGRAANASIVDLGVRHDGSAFVGFLTPPLSLPADTTVRMTATIRDVAGNMATASVTFFTSVTSAAAPTASFTATPSSGDAPLAVSFDASASADSGGIVMGWEWYFGDGATGIGRLVRHRYDVPGTYTATLRVRDDQGGVATTTRTITVTGVAPVDAGMADAGTPDAGCAPSCGGRTCGDDGCGGVCGTCAGGLVCAAGACACSGSAVDCGGACVDTRNDEAHCGACGNACGAGESCVASSCLMGGTDAGACVADCSGRSCGDDGCGGDCGTCASGQLCVSGGRCECPAGETACGAACIDVRGDEANCGGCGIACDAGEACVAGACSGGGDGGVMDAGPRADAGDVPPSAAGCACRVAVSPGERGTDRWMGSFAAAWLVWLARRRSRAASRR